jgi:hypothetical protein
MLAAYFVSPQRLQELRQGRGGALLEGFSEALKAIEHEIIRRALLEMLGPFAPMTCRDWAGL